ncbi:MAG: hypothetical protein KA715_08530 [Xanthomonadaceae bacterium]|nr:hypothetical protein [Xanthomonadaceae bacterium]
MKSVFSFFAFVLSINSFAQEFPFLVSECEPIISRNKKDQNSVSQQLAQELDKVYVVDPLSVRKNPEGKRVTAKIFANFKNSNAYMVGRQSTYGYAYKGGSSTSYSSETLRAIIEKKLAKPPHNLFNNAITIKNENNETVVELDHYGFYPMNPAAYSKPINIISNPFGVIEFGISYKEIIKKAIHYKPYVAYFGFSVAEPKDVYTSAPMIYTLLKCENINSEYSPMEWIDLLLSELLRY